jgi:hypothetical protein
MYNESCREEVRNDNVCARSRRVARALVANEYGVLKNAVREWFAEIQRGAALKSSAYQDFARNVVAKGDCIMTFNYDVSLERELRMAGKFELGDGYGRPFEGLPGKSDTKALKLHGSTNWLALLFGGMTSGSSAFQPGNTLGARPAIPKNELSFLGYTDAVDPAFGKGGAALPVMILNNSFQFHLHLLNENAKLIRVSPYTGKEEFFGGEMDWLAPGAGILLRIE